MFEKKGTFTISKNGVDEDSLLETSLDLGAEDFNSDADDAFVIETSPDDFGNMSQGLEDAGFDVEGEVGLVPINSVKVSGGDVGQLLNLLELLEDHEDIQKVYSNFDLDEEELEKLA
jgi:transcriptional/translational regulatory protein YebC/TACO1